MCQTREVDHKVTDKSRIGNEGSNQTASKKQSIQLFLIIWDLQAKFTVSILLFFNEICRT